MTKRDSLALFLLKHWLRCDMHKRRGGWRVAERLARGQDSAPIRFGDFEPVYVDLRGFDLLEISLLLASPEEPEFERDDRNLFRKLVRPGDTIYDIGANIGYHTVLFSAQAGPTGRVYAFEPQTSLLPNLRRTTSALTNTKLFECALSDHDGEATLYMPERGYHMLASMGDPGVKAHAAICKAAMLDSLFASGEVTKPDFVKIDVEGAEVLVFRGARDLLNRTDAPIVFFEQWTDAARRLGFQGTEAADTLMLFEKAQYGLFEASDGCLRELTSNTAEKCNLLAVPASRRGRVIQFSKSHSDA